MTFYVQKSETATDKALDSDIMVKLYPDVYGPRLDAIKELRDADDGSLYKGRAFRHVASFTNIPLFNAVSTILDPEFMKNKAKFYAWLRRNREYCTYDIRSHAVAPAGTETFIDGKPI